MPNLVPIEHHLCVDDWLCEWMAGWMGGWVDGGWVGGHRQERVKAQGRERRRRNKSAQVYIVIISVASLVQSCGKTEV